MWMEPAGVSVWKTAAGAVFGGEAGGQAVALQAAVNGAARQLGVDAAPHRLVTSSSGRARLRRSSTIKPSSHSRQRGGQAMRTGGAIDDVLAAFPARHGAAVDAELAGQRAVRGAAILDIGADPRRGGGVGVQLEMHQPASLRSGRRGAVIASWRRSPRWVHRHLPRAAPPDSRWSRRRRAVPSCGLPGRAAPPLASTGAAATFRTACHNREPSRQSSGTKHEGRG